MYIKRFTRNVFSIVLLTVLFVLVTGSKPSFADNNTCDAESLSAEGEEDLSVRIGPSSFTISEGKWSSFQVEVTPADAELSFEIEDDSLISIEKFQYQNYDNFYKILPKKKYGDVYFTVTASKNGKTVSDEGYVRVYCSDFYFAEDGKQIEKIRIPSDQEYAVSIGYPEGFDGSELTKFITYGVDPSLFKVRRGVIIPKAVGSTYFYATLAKEYNTYHGADDIEKSIRLEIFNRVQNIATDKEVYEGYPGDTIQIHANALPEEAEDKTLVYSSDNSSFSVDNTGKVSLLATASGSANITITAKDTGKVNKVVSVKAIDVINSIKLAAERIVAIPGDSLQLSPVIEPAVEDGVFFTSSSSNVTVDTKGLVKVSEKISKDEEAVITIKAKDAHSTAQAEVAIDIRTDVSSEIYKVDEGSSIEYDFRTNAGVSSANMIQIRNLDETIAKGEKIEKTSDGRYKLTVSGIKPGNTGIILTAIIDKNSSFYQYVNVSVQKAPEQKAPEQKAPEQKAPEQKAPEQKAPEQKGLETKVVLDDVTYEIEGTDAVITSSELKKGKATLKGSVTIAGKTYSVTKIKKRAFKKTKATNIVIPPSIKEIGDSAFEGSSLTQVTIGKNVSIIGKKAFYNSKKLKKIIVKGKKIKKVGKKAFKKLSKNVKYKLPKGVKLT